MLGSVFGHYSFIPPSMYGIQAQLVHFSEGGDARLIGTQP